MNAKKLKALRRMLRASEQDPNERMYQIIQVPRSSRQPAVFVTGPDGLREDVTPKFSIKVRLKPGVGREVYKRWKEYVSAYWTQERGRFLRSIQL